jgi:hypothetical protein
MVQLYLLGGSIVLAGFVWFWILRPIVVAAHDAYTSWRGDNEPLLRRARPRIPSHIMFRSNVRVETETEREPVYIPVSRYGGMATGMDFAKSDLPDMDAANTGMEDKNPPRDIMSDDTFLISLARAKLPNGKYRLSANKVFETVGGDRNAVMAKVKEIRATAEYRQLDGSTAPAARPITS